MLTQIRRFSLVGCAAAFLIWPFPANAVLYEIVAPSSSYVYLVPPEGPGVSGCQPDSFHCEFDISGSFVFGVDLMTSEGRFLALDLVLAGNETTTYGPLAAAGTVEWLLATQVSPLPLESTAGGSLLFRQPALGWNSIEVLITGNQLSLTGAYDHTFVDGNGHAFEVLAVAVPEPVSLQLIAAALTAAFAAARGRRPERKNNLGPP